MTQTATSQYLQSSSITDRGLNEKRKQNEDSLLDLPAVGLFVVADGVGGAQAGDVASQTAAEVLQEAFTNISGDADIEDLMEVAIQRANSAIHQMSREISSLKMMATTIVALHLANGKATIGHVGDSRCYRLDPKGNLFRETNDHSVVEDEVRAGRMTPEQAENHPSKNVISRALGADAEVEVDMKTLAAPPATTFLLCSDGITRHVSDNEIREILATCRTAEDTCTELSRLVFSRGAEDNLTAIVVKAGEGFGESQGIEEATLQGIRPSLAASTAITLDDAEILAASTFKTDGAAYRVEGVSAELSDDSARQYEKMKVERKQIERHVRRHSSSRRIFSYLGFLILGLAVGAASLFLWNLNQEKPQAELVMQSPDIAYSSYEDTRRAVDENPKQYLRMFGALAENAEDFYLKGRALLLEKKYAESAAALRKAKELLRDTPEVNRKVLEADIATSLGITTSKEAQAVFEKELPGATANRPANANANSNVRANAGAASNEGK
jgi:protein phosphatase